MKHGRGLALSVPSLIFLATVADAQLVSGSASGEAQPASDVATILRTPAALQSRARFDHLGAADGLTNDSVFSILQDRHGFLWFGTQAGLNRYDGYRVTQYRHDPRDPNSLSGDFVHNLLEDRHGAIWTGNDVLSRFDPQTGKFTQFPLPHLDSTDGRPAIIQRMGEDQSGFLWLGMGGGRTVYRFDPGSGTFSRFDVGATLPQPMENPIVGMFADPTGILWFGTGFGLIRFDPLTGASTPYTASGRHGSRTSVRAIAQDRAGNLWLASPEGQANFFDPATGAFSRRWAPPNRERIGTETNAILSGADGVVWLGTIDRLELFDPATGANAVLRHIAADRYSLSANEVQSLAKDRDGSVWVGTKGGGVNRFSPDSLRFGAWRRNPDDPRSLSDGNIRAICRDRAGVLWLGTYDGGLDRFDPASGTFAHFRHDRRKPESLDDDRVYSIYEDRAGDLWVGTSMGINRLDRKTDAFTHFKRGPFGPEGLAIPTYSLFEDSRGAFWFGVGEFKASLDRKTGAITSGTKTGGLSMHEDRDGKLWFASARTLTKMDASGEVRSIALPQTAGTNTPSTVQINFIHEDAQGLLWFAAESGLLRFDPKTEGFTSYTTREGLPDNVVQCILPDQAGNLWLSTNNGLSRFNPRDSSFSNFHESDGLQGEQFNRKACFAGPEGVLYFGGLHGFNMFDPRRIPAPREPSPVVLTEFRIHGDVVPIGPGSVLPRPVWLMDTLNLSHRDDAFSLEFAALSYSDQARTRYRFKLESLEAQWTEVDSRSRSARYTGLAPGRYRFRAQASTDGRTWSRQEASIGIVISPPWWMTPWSRSGAVMAVVGLLFGVYKLRVKTLHERGLRLEKLVDQRTAELDLARQQAEQASRAKSAFLANMSHELRTPLNAILGFSNILRKHSDSPEQRRNLEIINRSGEHLLTLINDVLDVAKIEAGRVVLEVAPCDLKTLVHEVTDMMRARAAEKYLELVLVESVGCPRHILTDAAKLREVLINLLGNAVKFTERGSVTLRLDAEPAATGERVLLRLAVEDTGIGIAKEDQERIFKPFEQVAKARSQKGTGLGLAITSQILALMGGRLEVESALGEGSCFRVELPVEPTQEIQAKPSPERELVLGLEAGQPAYRILVVEDQPENWMLLKCLLSDAGFEVRVAEDGRKGVAAFREWRPHFIWMDLRMPVLDGIEATRQIRALEGGRDVKIAAITASGFESRRSEVLAAGLDDYIRKPYGQDEIFQCMARHLGVRYRCAGSTSPSSGEPQVRKFSPGTIAALPAALRAELREALMTLDVNRISRTIEKVAEHDSALGSVLARQAETYAYTAMLSAVEDATEGSPSTNSIS